MINRRWFFSAAGAAFLSACSSVVSRRTPPASGLARETVARPPDADGQFEALLDQFFTGLESELKELRLDEKTPPQVPAGRAALEAIYRRPLTDIYRSRFDYRLELQELDNWKLLTDQACVLGQLTGLAFAYESGLKGDPVQFSFDRPKERPVLGVSHLEWARETYGFYTNPEIKKKRYIILCGETSRQIGEPCPFCQA